MSGVTDTNEAEAEPRLHPSITPTQVRIGDMAVELLQRGEEVHFFPKGHSMSPLIREFEEVLTRGCAPSELQVGEVVVMYQNNGNIVIHRLTRVVRRRDGLEIWTKGDGGIRWDNPSPLSACVGRAVTVKKPEQQLDLVSPYWRGAGYLAAQISLLQTLLLRVPGFGAYLLPEERNLCQRFWLHAAKLPFRGFIHVCLFVDRLRQRFGKTTTRN